MKKILLLIVPLLLLTGCNKQVFDFKYTFDKTYCNYNGNEFELKIDKWKIMMANKSKYNQMEKFI